MDFNEKSPMSSRDTKALISPIPKEIEKIKVAQQCVDETKCNTMSYVHLLTIERGFSFFPTKIWRVTNFARLPHKYLAHFNIC